MRDDQPQTDHTVTLLGDGPVDPVQLRRALAMAPRLIAADGGANHAHDHGLPVTQIVGDLDSLTNLQVWRNSGTTLTHLAEQNSTDFEKCIYTINACFYMGVGFLGRRLDHSLATLHTLAAYPKKRILLIGESDLVFLCPPRLSIKLPIGTRFSLFPLGPVTGRSKGLRWPIDGLEFAPGTKIGTSNAVDDADVALEMDAPLMLVMVPLDCLEAAAVSLGWRGPRG